MKPINPEELEVGLEIYTYRTDRKFIVDCIGRYALSCDTEMVGYRNVLPTDDAPAGQLWLLETSLLLKQFYTK